jgi:hypothetical protein
VFRTIFPELVPGALRRQLTVAEIQQRGWNRVWSLARSVLRWFDVTDEILADQMACEFIARAFDGRLLKNYKPEKGNLASFLRGTMRIIALERFRERSRERTALVRNQMLRERQEPGKADEQDKQLEWVRKQVIELPPAQRDAVARRYKPLADLDSGAMIPNERVTLHRGLKRLREKARENL